MLLVGCGSEFLHPLTHVSLGLWAAKRGSPKYVYVHHEQKKFVVVTLRDEPPPQADGRLGKAIVHVNQLLDKRNPFGWSPGECNAYRVVALELPWSSVVGIDYRCPLHDDGSIVLEARHLVKRTFKTLDDVNQFYNWGPKQHSNPQRQPRAEPAAAQHTGNAPSVRSHASRLQLCRNGTHSMMRLEGLAAAAAAAAALGAMPPPGGSGNRSSRCETPSSLLSDEDAQPSSHGPQQPDQFVRLRPPPPALPKGAGVRASKGAGINLTRLSVDSCKLPSRAPPVPALPLQRAGQRSPKSRGSCSAAGAPSNKALAAPHLAPNSPRRVRSTGDLMTLEEGAAAGASSADGSLRGSCSGYGEETGIPRASRWTTASAVYHSRTLVLRFRDPFLPESLRQFVKSDMRLLKLYESGLPAWAIFLPSYGLWYRPWMRRVAWTAFIAISIFSMACGFYDLYKNVPFLRQLVTSVGERMYLPMAEFFEWLERHTQVRLSILLTYLFSKSPLFISFMRVLRAGAALLGQVLQPAAAALHGAFAPALAAVGSLAHPLVAAAQGVGALLQSGAAGIASALGASMTGLGAALWSLLAPVVWLLAELGGGVSYAASVVVGPPARALWSAAALLVQLLAWLGGLLSTVLYTPMLVIGALGGALGQAGVLLWQQLQALWAMLLVAVQALAAAGRVAKAAAPVLSGGGKAAASAAAHSAGGGLAVWQWFGLEFLSALQLLRDTANRLMRSAQAVANFMITLFFTLFQHRVSLLLQLRRWLTQQKQRLPPSMANTVPGLASLEQYDEAPMLIPLPPPAGAGASPTAYGPLTSMEAYLATMADLDAAAAAMQQHHQQQAEELASAEPDGVDEEPDDGSNALAAGSGDAGQDKEAAPGHGANAGKADRSLRRRKQQSQALGTGGRPQATSTLAPTCPRAVSSRISGGDRSAHGGACFRPSAAAAQTGAMAPTAAQDGSNGVQRLAEGVGCSAGGKPDGLARGSARLAKATGPTAQQRSARDTLGLRSFSEPLLGEVPFSCSRLTLGALKETPPVQLAVSGEK